MSTFRPLAALAMVALIAAGCSNAGGDDGSAIATAKSTPNRDTAMRFAACMRQHGVSQFPDPGPSGELTIDGVLNGTSLDPGAPAWTNAIAACKDLQPSGFTGHKRSAEEQKPALKFAQCIRDNGVSDFPDPTPDSPLVDTNRIPSAASSDGMSILDAAMQTCRKLAAAALDGR